MGYYSFLNSTLRGNAELGDYNKVAVALILYLLAKENKRREKTGVVGWVDSLRLKVQCIMSREQIRVYTDQN